MDGLAERGAVFAVFVQLVRGEPGGDRFCVRYETLYTSPIAGELSEAAARAYLARAGAADVERLIADARAMLGRA
jgi:hypothetical protein